MDATNAASYLSASYDLSLQTNHRINSVKLSKVSFIRSTTERSQLSCPNFPKSHIERHDLKMEIFKHAVEPEISCQNVANTTQNLVLLSDHCDSTMIKFCNDPKIVDPDPHTHKSSDGSLYPRNKIQRKKQKSWRKPLPKPQPETKEAKGQEIRKKQETGRGSTGAGELTWRRRWWSSGQKRWTRKLTSSGP